MTTYEQARQIVQKEIPAHWVTAEWGYEADEYWQVVAGDPRYINDHDLDYQSLSDVVYIVRKSDGAYGSTAYSPVDPFFAAFEPYGDVPAFFTE